MGDSFKELIVWRRSVELSVAVYKLTEIFPKTEQFGLTNQMRRASVSVASNIAEGYGKTTKGEYLHFLGHARGSNFELQTQLVISEALSIGDETTRRTTRELSEEVPRMLVSMMKKLSK